MRRFTVSSRNKVEIESILKVFSCHKAICDNDYVNNVKVKVRDHCCIIGKCRGSAHRDCNIKS